MNIGIEGNLDDRFALRPLKPGAMDWLLPALEVYPAALRTACTVHVPHDQEQAIFLHPGEPVFDRFRTVICKGPSSSIRQQNVLTSIISRRR